MTSLFTTSLLVLNLITFILYGLDKHKARRGQWRISEATLLLLAVFGGSPGAWCGMKLFHHKTQHKKFYIGLPLIFLLQLITFLYLYVVQPFA